ncbi:hypothetical protein JG687_00010997 [Phytophthora cactorum]|uniref:WW domain-containing protein n=2 Tax=Phytophthora cactorum TaxID=29920 RepID=A0A8T1U7L2_9STRA|nr:hypothetical protein JG687_00010997 [Phytophthora cactorum]
MSTTFLRSRRLLPFLAAPTALLSVSSAHLEAAEPEPTSQPAVDFVGVFVEKESAARLRQQFPAKFGNADEPLVVVLRFQPTAEEQEAFAPIFGRAAKLHVKGLAEDDHAQTVLVAVTTETGESLEYDGAAEPAHVTLSTSAGGLSAGYSSVLLERLRASDKLRYLLDDEEGISQWTGELPAFESKHLPLFSPFPAVEAKIVKVDAKQSEQLALQGTVCLSSRFDVSTGECQAPKAECGFCKFMKAGPCGKEFTAWEACLDSCKKSGDDFIEKCGPQTLALRDCVDANPEYYHVLSDDPEEKKDESEAEDKSTTKRVTKVPTLSFNSKRRGRNAISNQFSVDGARRVNAGVYLLENVKTGHRYFGTTWDLHNAAAQSFHDLQLGVHPHQALSTSFQLYGEAASGIRFRVLEQVSPPSSPRPPAPTDQVRAKRRRVKRLTAGRDADNNKDGFDVRAMERKLATRLRFHQRKVVRFYHFEAESELCAACSDEFASLGDAVMETIDVNVYHRIVVPLVSAQRAYRAFQTQKRLQFATFAAGWHVVWLVLYAKNDSRNSGTLLRAAFSVTRAGFLHGDACEFHALQLEKQRQFNDELRTRLRAVAAQIAESERVAATRIQTIVRGRQARIELYRRKRQAARSAREQLRDRAVELEVASATCIQRRVRERITMPASHQRLRAQCCARCFLSRRTVKRMRMEKQSAVRIQRAFRYSRAKRRLARLVDDDTATPAPVWVELFDEASGYVYYYHTETGQSVWERPQEMDTSPENPTSENVGEWVEYWDENVDASYFYNVKTGEATWSTPAGYQSSNQEDTTTSEAWPMDNGGTYYTLPSRSKMESTEAENQQMEAYGDQYAPYGYEYGEDQAYYGNNNNEGAYYYYGDGTEYAYPLEPADNEQYGPVDTEYDINYKIYLTQIQQEQQQEDQQSGNDQQQQDQKRNDTKCV